MQKDFNQRGKSNKTEDDDDDGLLVFGYACKMYPPCEKADYVAEERHLQSWNGDGSLRLDRYDCRLLLTRIDDRPPENEEEACPTEEMEEEMCDEERYKDMYLDIQTVALKEQEERKKKAEITFDYGTSTVGQVKEEDSDSEDEPFEPPPGIKLPVGLATPDNLKQSHIIERTAMFVVSKGPQMEIVIKAKQRNNAEQFGFLEFDNVLYPYYKYISKLIREKKYTPDFTKKKEKAEPAPVQKKPANALTAIAAEHSDSDSDSDCELHPSLFAVKKREPSPDIIDRTRNAAGPRQKPAETSPIRPNYDIKQSNDMYASLFKSLTGYTDPPPQEKAKEVKKEIKAEPVPEPIDPDVDIEWQQWWMKFYGSPAPAPAPKPMIPPPPDMGPIVMRYAEFVARHGAQAELSLVARPDLKLHFMDPNSPFFSYYQHRVRYAQWEMAQTNESSASASTSQAEAVSTPESSMNRKQRRRLQDAQKVGPAPPPGVVDPMALKAIEINPDLHKTQSCPANLGASVSPGLVLDPPRKPYVATGGPVSFTLAKEESKMLPVKTVLGDEDDPLTAMLANSSPGPSEADSSAREAIDDLMNSAPEPPAIQNNQQLDRKEKARVFMEKLLKEKRNTKAREAEEAKLRQLEQQKMELEQELAEEEKTEEFKEEEKKMDLDAGKTLDLIDQMINSRIDNLLQSTGIALVQESPEKKKEREENERKRSRESSKKHKHKRKRSRSRTRSRSRDREYRRRRSRSRSRDRDSRRRRYH